MKVRRGTLVVAGVAAVAACGAGIYYLAGTPYYATTIRYNVRSVRLTPA